MPAPQTLLQVLQEASVAEVVDVSTEKHQLWVDVLGHTAVGGRSVANYGWHNEGGGSIDNSVPTAFHQGTKSGEQKNKLKKHTSHPIKPDKAPLYFQRPKACVFWFSPAVLRQREDVAFVFDASHAVHVLVAGRKDLILLGEKVGLYGWVWL